MMMMIMMKEKKRKIEEKRKGRYVDNITSAIAKICKDINRKKKKEKKKIKIYLINLESYIAVITPSLDWHHFILPNSPKSPRLNINLTSNRGFVSDESPARVIGEPFLRFATTLDTGEFLFPIFSFYSYATPPVI